MHDCIVVRQLGEQEREESGDFEEDANIENIEGSTYAY